MDFKRIFAFLLVLTLSVSATMAAKVKTINDDPETLLSHVAQLNLKYKDYPQAVKDFQKLLGDYPKSNNAKDYTYFLALSFERANNFQSSAENYQKVVTDYKKATSAIANIDSLSLEGVGRCFNKNFKENAAIINGQPMTKLELDAELEKVPSYYRSQFEGEDGRKKFLDQIIERKLLYNEAVTSGIINDPETYQRIQENEQNILIRGLCDKEVTKKSQPSEAEIKDYYKKNINNYKTPDQVKASQILVEDNTQAQKIYKELFSRKGQPFDSLVVKYSVAPNAKSGGGVGLITKDQVPVPDPSFFKTPAGKYTKVIPTEPMYAVVKLEKKEGNKLHLRWVETGTEEDAKQVISELNAAPESFESIAAKKSSHAASKDKGGDLGLVGKGEIAEEVFKAASTLKPGKYTAKPVKFFTKFAIYRIDENSKAGFKPLDQVQSPISQQLQKERQQSLFEDLMKRLKDEAKIEYIQDTPETETDTNPNINKAPLRDK